MTNTAIRTVRESLRLSQEEMAERVRQAGEELGEPNGCTVRTVQRWESGAARSPRRVMVRALEHATGQSIETLGFEFVPSVGRLSDHTDTTPVRVAGDTRTQPIGDLPGTLTGVWESRCTYHSGSRGEDLLDLAHVVLVHSGREVTARSIEGAMTDGSLLVMRLELRGHIVTGTWEEATGPESYYRGQVFYGAIQMQVDPAGTRMSGAWLGFGRDSDINTGAWEMILREHGTRGVDDYAHVPTV